MQNFAVCLAWLIAYLSAGATLSTVTGEGGTIYLSVVVSNAPVTLNSSRVLSAVDRAIQFINNDPTILPRHRLQRSLLSTQVSLRDSQVVVQWHHTRLSIYDGMHLHYHVCMGTL